jgi:hypothetical protein
MRGRRTGGPTAPTSPTTPRTLAAVVLAVSLLTQGCAMDASDEDSGEASHDLVTVARHLVGEIDDLHETHAPDGPLVERVVRGPTSCVDPPDPDRFEASVALAVLLPEDADVEDVLEQTRQRWDGQGLQTEMQDEDELLPRVAARDPDREISYAAEIQRELALLTLLGRTSCRALPDGYDHVVELREEFRELVDPDGQTLEADLDRPLAEVVADLRAQER